MTKVNWRAKRSIWRNSGVVPGSTAPSIVPMRPISVAGPVATATPTPRPAAMSVPEKAIGRRSPSGASRATFGMSLSTATDSPVSAASCALRPRASISRRSAGTRSPGSISTISPGTRSSAGMRERAPSRRTEASFGSIERTAARAVSARPSCHRPMAALSRTTAKITLESAQCPRAAVPRPAAISTWIRRLAN